MRKKLRKYPQNVRLTRSFLSYRRRRASGVILQRTENNITYWYEVEEVTRKRKRKRNQNVSYGSSGCVDKHLAQGPRTVAQPFLRHTLDTLVRETRSY